MDDDRREFSNLSVLGEAANFAPDRLVVPSADGPGVPTLSAGERLGQFVVLGQRPHAGPLSVYIARDAMLDRTVLLYACPRDLAEAFRARVRALAQFRHPQLFALHDMIETNGGPVAVCAYEDGRSVGAFLQEGPSSAEIHRVIAESFVALEVLHRHDVTIGSIDLERMLVSPAGALKLCALAPTDGKDHNDVYALLRLWHASLQAANLEAPQALAILLERAQHAPLSFGEIRARFNDSASASIGSFAALKARTNGLAHLRGFRFDIVLVVAIVGLGAALAWTPTSIPDESSTAVVPQEIILPPPLPRQFEVNEQHKNEPNTDKYASLREAWAER